MYVSAAKINRWVIFIAHMGNFIILTLAPTRVMLSHTHAHAHTHWVVLML